jgi:hypothetical protein
MSLTADQCLPLVDLTIVIGEHGVSSLTVSALPVLTRLI